MQKNAKALQAFQLLLKRFYIKQPKQVTNFLRCQQFLIGLFLIDDTFVSFNELNLYFIPFSVVVVVVCGIRIFGRLSWPFDGGFVAIY